ncbi:hypothetical protein CKO36_09920 [Rhabdochromatium marinum]|nr:hypothetical protein [Rhabdochromatium marinum]
MHSSIINCYELLVRDEMFRVCGKAFATPPDQDLLADITCLALNQLPARYVRHSVDLSANLTSDESQSMKHQVEQAVSKAISIVKRRQDGER